MNKINKKSLQEDIESVLYSEENQSFIYKETGAIRVYPKDWEIIKKALSDLSSIKLEEYTWDKQKKAISTKFDGNNKPNWLQRDIKDIFVLDKVPSGVMSTIYVWVGPKQEFWDKHSAAGDNYSFNYDAPIPSFALEDPAALLEFINIERWDEFAKLIEKQYSVFVVNSPLIPIILAKLRKY